MARQNQKTATRKKPVSRKVVRRAGKTPQKQSLFLTHEHSFRLRHHRHTSYPLIALLLLLVGLLLFNWTSLVSGLDYGVVGKVPAPPLTEPATISTPSDGSTVHALPLSVNGRCPVGSYVKLNRNNFFSGVALCDADGTFHIQTDLFEGANELMAQDYNITDDAGPASPHVVVHYQPLAPVVPPVTPASPARPSSTPATPAAPFTIGSDFLFKGYRLGQTINWQFSLSGGSAPYAVHIDWGDGTSDTLSRAQAGAFGVTHTYRRASRHLDSYIIKAEASDADGTHAFVQLLAIVAPDAAAASAAGTSGGGSATDIGNFLKSIWPIYGSSVLLVASFWLGERRAYERLRPLLRHRPRHA